MSVTKIITPDFIKLFSFTMKVYITKIDKNIVRNIFQHFFKSYSSSKFYIDYQLRTKDIFF